MPINIEEIKKLPDTEKLRLIDELLSSIDDESIDAYLYESEVDNILRERWEKFQSGKMKFSSFEEAMNRLKTNSAERNKKRNE